MVFCTTRGGKHQLNRRPSQNIHTAAQHFTDLNDTCRGLIGA